MGVLSRPDAASTMTSSGPAPPWTKGIITILVSIVLSSGSEIPFGAHQIGVMYSDQPSFQMVITRLHSLASYSVTEAPYMVLTALFFFQVCSALSCSLGMHGH